MNIPFILFKMSHYVPKLIIGVCCAEGLHGVRGACAPGQEQHIMLYCTKLSYAILYYTVLNYPILYYTILYYTILYYTILYYNITILYLQALLSFIKTVLLHRSAVGYE